MIIYLDGSSGSFAKAKSPVIHRTTPQTQGVIGWGLIILEQDSYVEVMENIEKFANEYWPIDWRKK